MIRDAHRRLEDAYETIRELSCNEDEVEFRRKNDIESYDGDETEMASRSHYTEIGVQVDDTTMIEHIHSLQQELIETHSRKSDLENMAKDLKMRIYELESANKRLKRIFP